MCRSLLTNAASMNPTKAETNPPVSLLGTLLVRANEGPTFSRGAHSVVILLDGKQTGEKFATVLVTSPPGGGPGLRRLWAVAGEHAAHKARNPACHSRVRLPGKLQSSKDPIEPSGAHGRGPR